MPTADPPKADNPEIIALYMSLPRSSPAGESLAMTRITYLRNLAEMSANFRS